MIRASFFQNISYAEFDKRPQNYEICVNTKFLNDIVTTISLLAAQELFVKAHE